ncbi:MAG: hypothetical protein J6C05_03035 [Prevotella sp.]|nr:hypothetical protein [Prevotella sp.]
MGRAFFYFVYGLVDTFYLIYRFLKITIINRRCFFINHFEIADGEDIGILANGPSLNKVLRDENKIDIPTCAMNFFGNTDEFLRIRPRYYCIVDPRFINQSDRNDIKSLFAVFNEKVDWNMTLYIDADFSLSKFLKSSSIENKNINVIPVNLSAYEGFHCLDNFFYDINFASPIIGTVAVMCIFVAIKMGYKKIHLYGVEHNFFDGMFVDKDNILCATIKHFYDKDSSVKKLKEYTVESYIEDKVLMFKGHRLVAQYAKHKNVEILNHTINSWIDVYKKC